MTENKQSSLNQDQARCSPDKGKTMKKLKSRVIAWHHKLTMPERIGLTMQVVGVIGIFGTVFRPWA
jgi:hypothetical protein